MVSSTIVLVYYILFVLFATQWLKVQMALQVVFPLAALLTCWGGSRVARTWASGLPQLSA